MSVRVRHIKDSKMSGVFFCISYSMDMKNRKGRYRKEIKDRGSGGVLFTRISTYWYNILTFMTSPA